VASYKENREAWNEYNRDRRKGIGGEKPTQIRERLKAESKERVSAMGNRGVFERPKGSGIWWVRYADQHGKLHREKGWS